MGRNNTRLAFVSCLILHHPYNADPNAMPYVLAITRKKGWREQHLKIKFSNHYSSAFSVYSSVLVMADYFDSNSRQKIVKQQQQRKGKIKGPHECRKSIMTTKFKIINSVNLYLKVATIANLYNPLLACLLLISCSYSHNNVINEY